MKRLTLFIFVDELYYNFCFTFFNSDLIHKIYNKFEESDWKWYNKSALG